MRQPAHQAAKRRPPRHALIDIPGRQRGMTLWSLLYVLITLGLLGLVAARSVPVYLNAHDVRATIDWAADQPSLVDASAAEIQAAIQRRFDAGYVTNVNGRDIAISKTATGREISVAYEVRRPMLFNMSLLYSFAESAQLTGTDDG